MYLAENKLKITPRHQNLAVLHRYEPRGCFLLEKGRPQTILATGKGACLRTRREEVWPWEEGSHDSGR